MNTGPHRRRLIRPEPLSLTLKVKQSLQGKLTRPKIHLVMPTPEELHNLRKNLGQQDERMTHTGQEADSTSSPSGFTEAAREKTLVCTETMHEFDTGYDSPCDETVLPVLFNTSKKSKELSASCPEDEG